LASSLVTHTGISTINSYIEEFLGFNLCSCSK
jgi:hypothetical protein